MDCSPPARLLCPWDSPGKNTGVGCHALLQGIFPTQGSNPDLPHYRQILYCLSHQGSLRILEWVAIPFLQGIFPTQGSNPSLPHYRQILYHLSHQGNSIKPWVGPNPSLGLSFFFFLVIKNAEHRRTDAFQSWYWRRLLRIP